MLGQFTRQEKSNRSLDLAGCDGRSLVVVGQAGGLGGNALEDVIHERVHDGHGLRRDTSVWVDLLQDLIAKQTEKQSLVTALNCNLQTKYTPCRCRSRRIPSSFSFSSSCPMLGQLFGPFRPSLRLYHLVEEAL